MAGDHALTRRPRELVWGTLAAAALALLAYQAATSAGHALPRAGAPAPPVTVTRTAAAAPSGPPAPSAAASSAPPGPGAPAATLAPAGAGTPSTATAAAPGPPASGAPTAAAPPSSPTPAPSQPGTPLVAADLTLSPLPRLQIGAAVAVALPSSGAPPDPLTLLGLNP